MATPTPDRIVVQCSCGAKLKVSAAVVGRKAKCPQCGEVFVVSTPAQAAKTRDRDAGDEGISWLEDLARAEKTGTSAATEKPAGGAQACPHCGAVLAAGTVLCVACGYNTNTGRTVKAASAKTSAVADKAAALAKGAGGFVLGCVASVIGALLGAGIWCGVSLATGYEIGWIAWGLGGLAGFGMTLGYRDRSAVAGVVAACISLLGIFVAKVAVFAFLFYGVMTGDTENIEAQRTFVTLSITEDILTEKGATDQAAREAQWDGASAQAKHSVAAMSDEQVRKLCEEKREELARREAEEPDTTEDLDTTGAPETAAAGSPKPLSPEEEAEVEEATGAVVSMFFSTMFSPIDLLFVLFALGTAYKIAAGTGSG